MPIRLAVAHVAAPVDTPSVMKNPVRRESESEYCVTATKLGPGIVSTRNHALKRLRKAKGRFKLFKDFDQIEGIARLCEEGGQAFNAYTNDEESQDHDEVLHKQAN
jgi:hypothetical protein